MTGVTSKDLTPHTFACYAAQLAAFKASEERRRYEVMYLTVYIVGKARQFWLTDKGLELVDRLEAKR